MAWAGLQEKIQPKEKCFLLDSFYRTNQELRTTETTEALRCHNTFMKDYAVRAQRLKTTIVAACTLVSVLIGGCQSRGVASKAFPKSAEVQRISSSNGQFDAVLIRDEYGGAAGGGIDSNVYIVRKGAAVYHKPGKEVFSADPMTGGKLVWRRDHLLEIHYDLAYIHQFRNVWGLYEIENVGSAGERDYSIELSLIPVSDSPALN
jgi:hypothetical protein